MKFYINGTRRGLGKALKEKYGSIDSLKECDVFINCKHDGFEQVKLLYYAASMNKRIINISSAAAGVYVRGKAQIYSIEKKALDDANTQLFYTGINTTSVKFGYFDSPRSAHKNVEKMPIDYCVEVIDWLLNQPYRVKEITVSV
jgi:hypothetical protein